MRNLLQADCVAQAGCVGQDAHDAAVVRLEELLQNQTGEHLRLGEDLGAEAMTVGRQGILADLEGNQCDLPWRLAGRAHGPLSTRSSRLAQVLLLENIRVFYRAFLTPLSADPFI